LSFGGTFDPCAYGELMSIGRIGIEENKKFSNEIMSLLEARLGVPPTRFYITFNDAKPQDVGFNKSTFHGIL
jgi:phenylpyruvate tautomerase